MGHAVVRNLAGRVEFIHTSFLSAAEDLDEASFRASPGAKAPSIGFHLWHTARWADAFQERFGAFAGLARFAGREQIWNARRLADAWGLSGALGKEATGMGLDDDASAALSLPAKAEVATYARDAFAAAEAVFADVDDDELILPTADFYDDGGWVVLDHFGWHLTHASRHLGMIEALKGVLGSDGTATV